MAVVSVIIPVYKCENYIENTVESILAQKHKDIRIVLVDDGSPDNSGIICDKLASTNGCIRVIHKENGGPASAVHDGVLAAEGDYICFVDGDDTVSCEYVSGMLSLIEDNNCDLAVTGFQTVSDGRTSETKGFTVPSGVYDREKIINDIYPKLLMGSRFTDRAVSFSRCGKMFRADMLRSIIEEATVHVFHGEDGFMVRSYILKCGGIVLADKYYYNYVKTNTNSITTRSDKRFFEQAKLLYERNKELFAECPEYDFSAQNEKWINAAAYISIRELWHCFGNEEKADIKKRISDIVFDKAVRKNNSFVSSDKLEARMTKYVRNGNVNGLYNIIKLMAIKYKQPLRVKPTRIYGYTCVNFGDDLFFRLLARRYPKRRFILYAPKIYKLIYSAEKNITVINRDSLFARASDKLKKHFREKMLDRKCGSSVLIGGSVYVQRGAGWKNRLNPSKTPEPYGRPHYVVSANFGPFEDEEYRNYFEKVFSSYTDVCFRDSRSAGYFPVLDNVRYAPDAVFTVDPGDTSPKGKYAVVTAVDAYGRASLKKNADDYYSAIKNACEALMSRGYSIKAACFCESEGDMNILDRLAKESGGVEIVSYKGDIDSIIGLFAHSSFVIASRFHAMILGWVCGKPVLPVVYDEKMLSVMKDCGYSGEYIDAGFPVFNGEMLNACIPDVDEIRSKAAKQFEKLDSFLNY